MRYFLIPRWGLLDTQGLLWSPETPYQPQPSAWAQLEPSWAPNGNTRLRTQCLQDRCPGVGPLGGPHVLGWGTEWQLNRKQSESGSWGRCSSFSCSGVGPISALAFFTPGQERVGGLRRGQRETIGPAPGLPGEDGGWLAFQSCIQGCLRIRQR